MSDSKPAEGKASINEVKAFFEADGGRKVQMAELKDLKTGHEGKDYDDIALGIGNGSLTY